MLPHKSNNAIWFIIFLLALFLAGNFVFTQYEFVQIKNILHEPTNSPATIIIPPTPISTPVSTSTPTITPTPRITVISPPSPQAISKITYIPLTGGSTQNTDWVNISSSQFTLNIGDYGSKSYAIWDANLRVDNANGTTFVRLFDTTHGIAVNGSEISISDTSSSTDVISGALNFWAGNNTYVVQIKSLNSSTAFMDSGRIKISY